MKNRRNFKGFAHQGALLLIVLVAAIAAVGYRVYLNNNTKGSVTKAAAVAKSTTANVTTKADLQQASQSLDTDNGDSQLDPTQLDSTLNQLL